LSAWLQLQPHRLARCCTTAARLCLAASSSAVTPWAVVAAGSAPAEHSTCGECSRQSWSRASTCHAMPFGTGGPPLEAHCSNNLMSAACVAAPTY
jgi:hypothetical protein